jgi:hypothetical protein
LCESGLPVAHRNSWTPPPGGSHCKLFANSSLKGVVA